MADLDTCQQCATEDELNQLHKQERKVLQAEIQKLKHTVVKGDRKKKKEVNEKIAILEAELDAKQEKERAEFKEGQDGEKSSDAGAQPAVSDVCEDLQQLTTEDQEVEAGDQGNRKKKASKAQKRREKKSAKDQERESRIRDQDVVNLTSSRHLEDVSIKKTLSRRGLQTHWIQSDGNCLYAAVAHQLGLRDIKTSTESLRQQVAGYMRTHSDDFMPFLTKDNGDCYTQEDFEEYCKLTETTPAWGGQLEIQALSTVLEKPVEVVQADGPPIVTGHEHDDKPLTLTYYRHAFGLGEHYNSVEAKTEDSGDEFT